ncbi:unnamed protein product [Parajaminaea phylloscopi]
MVDIYQALAGTASLALVLAFLCLAAVPRVLGAPWDELLPSWLTVFAHDVISPEDIAELKAQDEAASGPAKRTTVIAADETTERTPLLSKSHLRSAPVRWYTSPVLTVVSLFHLLLWISLATYHLEARTAFVTSSVLVAQLSIWSFAFARSISSRHATPAYDLLAVFILQLLTNVVRIYQLWGRSDAPLLAHAGSVSLCIVALATIVSLPLTTEPPSDGDAAEDRCTLWQWMTFSWLSPLIAVAVTRPLEKADVWAISRSCRSSLLLRKFKQVPGLTLPRRILRANNHDILLDITLTLASAILSYASPFFLKRILHAIESPSGDRRTAYLYAVFSFTADILKSQTDLQHLFYGRRACIRIRGQLIASIYEKALRTRDMSGVLGTKDPSPSKTTDDKPAAAKDASSDDAASIGKVVSLAAVDSIRISAQAASAYMLYSAPIEFVVASLFLYQLLGWSAFAGFIVLFVASPLQSTLTRQMISISKHLSAARDKRLGALNELTQNLKFVKFYAFEAEMKRRITDLREKELAWLRKRQMSQAGVMLLWSITPAAVTTVSFASYVLIAKRDLDVSTAFTSIALFQLLRGPLNALPMQINELLNAKVSSDRIQEFFQADEVATEVSSMSQSTGRLQDAHRLQFGCEDATFKWPTAPTSTLTDSANSPASMWRRMWNQAQRRLFGSKQLATTSSATSEADPVDDASIKPFELTGVTFMPPQGDLCLVYGPTGSGKSALLAALLGEMELVSGKSHIYKNSFVDPRTGFSNTIAYCAQTPWLQHASIKANILFGSPYDRPRYEAVLDACALRPDLEILDGDETEIGEKGVSLSGGQQARVALARALYSRAATLFLDDPLSAVDAHTAAKLVKDCLRGPLMKGRTTVLVTHHAELILDANAANWVAELSEGTILRQGKPGEFKQKSDKDGVLSPAAVSQDQGPTGPASDAKAEDSRDTPKPRKLVDEETRAKGGVKKEVYKMYLEAIGYPIAICVVAALIAYKGTDLAEKGWLAYWGASYARAEDIAVTIWSRAPPSSLSLQYLAQLSIFSAPSAYSKLSTLGGSAPVSQSSTFPPAHQSPGPYILVFFGIQLLSAALIVVAALLTFYGSLNASRSLFDRMLTATMGATNRWLDKTPSGRIVNKFSRDIEVVDSSINQSLRYFVTFLIAGVISVLTIIAVLPTFVVPTIVLGAANIWVARGYIRAARDLRRLESVSRSPIFSAFSELLQGIGTVRAYAAESRMLKECTDRIDLANSFFLYFWLSNRWLLFRLDVLGATAIFLAAVAALHGTIAAGLAGLALTQAQSIVQAGYWMARMYTTLEQDANSIERVREALDETPQEPPAIIPSNRPPANWPSQGKVEVKGLVLRYAPDLPPVLHGLNFTVEAGEKVGVVGRTGSGKSTTALAFFRFVEFDAGQILIDGLDISKMGLHDLRSRLTIIPQNAVLFSGTVRDNLDPFGTHSDEECLAALHSVHIRTTPISTAASASNSRAASIKDGVEGPHRGVSGGQRLSVPPADNPAESGSFAGHESPSHNASQTYVTLSTRVTEGGSNFSQGQRQLLAMARALLRRTRLILMDEASSAVDLTTDSLVQRTVRTGFKDATVITIAHRLHTVAHADKVLVLDNGTVKEFGTPAELLKVPEGAFKSMCDQSGDAASLYRQVQAAEEERQEARRRQSKAV